jgi:hypothetical protein
MKAVCRRLIRLLVRGVVWKDIGILVVELLLSSHPFRGEQQVGPERSTSFAFPGHIEYTPAVN